MSLCTRSLFRRIQRVHERKFSALSAEENLQKHPRYEFRTSESNPIKHNSSQLYKVYTVKNEIQTALYPTQHIPKLFLRELDIFGECSCLIRNPAVETISYLNQADYTKPINRYVLYGKIGVGKSRTLLHLLHYAFENDFIILYVPWPQTWFKFPKEVAPSAKLENMVDLPVEAGAWLQLFKQQNIERLSKLNLCLSQDYTWSQRESAEKGSPLLNIVDFGIQRIKYACEVVQALVDELKVASTAGKCKTFVAIDGYNALIDDYTQVKIADRKNIPADQITLSKAFISAVNYDWCNGAAVLIVDQLATKSKRESELPKYLLGSKGFDYLSPFIPIEVEKYTHYEFEVMIQYYKDRKWVRDITAMGQQELELISARNPLKLMEVCTPL